MLCIRCFRELDIPAEVEEDTLITCPDRHCRFQARYGDLKFINDGLQIAMPPQGISYVSTLVITDPEEACLA